MPLLDKARLEVKFGKYGTGQATLLSDVTLLPRVQDYRRQLSGRAQSLSKADIRQKLPTCSYHVSRKIDGEFTVLVYRDGEAFTLNPGGTVRCGMAWLDEAVKLLSAAGVKEALVAGELYVDTSSQGRRCRVHDVVRVARAPESATDVGCLRFAVFDLLSLDQRPPGGAFAETWAHIARIFGSGKEIRPVACETVPDADNVERLFEQWVEKEGEEGLVARSDEAGIFKLKPLHTLDAAVIGFTEGTDDRQGMVHDLLLAVARQDGALQVLSHVGGGFSDAQRRTMLSDLKDLVVDSEYVEVNSDHVAYQMVRPEWVVEISCLDLISQNTRGGPINRMVLDWHANNGHSQFNVVQRLPLATVISPQFLRRREDKKATPLDVSVRQISTIVEVPLVDRDARQAALPTSEILRREVYTKSAKGEIMVRKFVLWKTNKETAADDFPAYVFHFTDYSPNRATPLSRDVRVSSSRAQIEAIYEQFKTENVKQGWVLHAGAAAAAPVAETASAPSPAAIAPPAAEKPAAKPRAKKSKGETPDAAAPVVAAEAAAAASPVDTLSAPAADPVAPAPAAEAPASTPETKPKRAAPKRAAAKKTDAPAEQPADADEPSQPAKAPRKKRSS